MKKYPFNKDFCTTIHNRNQHEKFTDLVLINDVYISGHQKVFSTAYKHIYYFTNANAYDRRSGELYNEGTEFIPIEQILESSEEDPIPEEQHYYIGAK